MMQEANVVAVHDIKMVKPIKMYDEAHSFVNKLSTSSYYLLCRAGTDLLL